MIGYFYLDLFPREGKYSHQCCFPLRPSCLLPGGKRQKPEAVIIGNNPKAREGIPSLLKFSEVETFFHEFGHVMHAVCSVAKYSRFAWSWSVIPSPGGVEIDFLEVPSSMLENWVYDSKVIKLLSCHFKTQSPLPPHLGEKLNQIRHLDAALLYSKLIFMSLADMTVHQQLPPYHLSVPSHSGIDLGKTEEITAKDMGELFNKLHQHFCLSLPLSAEKEKNQNQTQNQTQNNPFASWYHPIMGYDAGYYGYLWAMVYAFDMFTVFEKSSGGCFDITTGRKYRKEILEPAATRDGMEMVKKFLGRDPSISPLLEKSVFC
eukprot:TRINITY_DN766_c0_g1_i4.p1 TRINITY_DN766_c0_g1~~TRINITY_DN766_c0_g1_i4.p1  ORF type:complete len:370 (-),score=94.30 TRINITY_DN766_c0_g1_i4:94-1047(-)